MPQKKTDPVRAYAAAVYGHAGTFEVKIARTPKGKRVIQSTRRTPATARYFRVKQALLQEMLDRGMLKVLSKKPGGWATVDLSLRWQRKVVGF